ncbi:MAG: hypothetical protein J0L69_06600 [Bacteroidetes bacterium]|nr:hypothetical protein [Bacteroidota bacterium]
MRYCSHKRYQSEAIEGVTYIKVRTYKWTLYNEGLLPKLKPGFENYDLYFNKKGLLLYSYHYNRQGASELNKFAYYKGRLINIQTVYFPSHEMKSVSIFYYDEQGRLIKEIISSGRNDPDEEPEVINYIYEKNLITEIYVEPYDEVEHKIETFLDDEGNELEY